MSLIQNRKSRTKRTTVRYSADLYFPAAGASVTLPPRRRPYSLIKVINTVIKWADAVTGPDEPVSFDFWVVRTRKWPSASVRRSWGSG